MKQKPSTLAFVIGIILYAILLNAFRGIANDYTIAVIPFATSVFCMKRYTNKDFIKDKPFYGFFFLMFLVAAVYIAFFYWRVK